MQARDRILAVLARRVKERRASPADDGLNRILQARTAAGETPELADGLRARVRREGHGAPLAASA